MKLSVLLAQLLLLKIASTLNGFKPTMLLVSLWVDGLCWVQL